MQSLNIAKNRSSFIPYVATDNTEQKSKLHYSMTRILNGNDEGRIDLLAPFQPRAQTFRVNVELSIDYHGHTHKTFFEPRGHFWIFLIKMFSKRPHSNH